MEDKKEEHGTLLGPAASVSPGAISRLRQLSIPVWARFLALFLAVTTLVAGAALGRQGWSSCTVGCNEKWLENGTKIIGASFVQVSRKPMTHPSTSAEK